ncbi:hypothetical protein PRZ48_011962 [Zasmidium cellare]|uniref:N-acetyltransferase domain-containing protein n=1 Tax=Zasmidium cellare TaxID=395010 RepID=A0ABR0E8F9_ZASCE|nr:hypothetical protein PRZ48_011962 [Zasmidium cellare]
MPTAMLDDPLAQPIYRNSGQQPFPEPYGPLPEDIVPRTVTLRDRTTTATLVPFSSPHQVPAHLNGYLCALLNREIEKGDTYPMTDTLAMSVFGQYWFANFGAIMFLGDIQTVEEVTHMEERGADWSKQCLGSFYIKPNYPGRSSHVCNGGFLVTDAARNRGVGRLMGEGYLEWAPKLGYTYSVFNLVYETNVASLRIWDALGFKRIGRVKGCGNLKSYPDQLIDAIIFGRELGGEGDEYVSEERFEKIRFYLKNGTYPNGSDRAEKSRLRSAATHYRLVPNDNGDGDDDKLMLKGKEVISDPHKQYEIARNMHIQSHGGINKTTAAIAEKYHWVRIKETVSAAIRNCNQCKDSTTPKPASATGPKGRASTLDVDSATPIRATPRQTVRASADPSADAVEGAVDEAQQQNAAPTAPMQGLQYTDSMSTEYGDMPVDPQIMQSMHDWTSSTAAQHAMHIDTGDNKVNVVGIDEQDVDDEEEDDDNDDTARLRDELESAISYGGAENDEGYTATAASQQQEKEKRQTKRRKLDLAPLQPRTEKHVQAQEQNDEPVPAQQQEMVLMPPLQPAKETQEAQPQTQDQEQNQASPEVQTIEAPVMADFDVYIQAMMQTAQGTMLPQV